MITKENLGRLRVLAANLQSAAPMSADMLRRVVGEIERGGPLTAFLVDHPEANTPLFGVRLLAGMKWLVLTGRAATLVEHLRVLLARGDDPVYRDQTWALWRQTALGNPVEIRAALDRPVQQHHPQRARQLLRGLGMLAAPRVRLFELGACAGLNLILDRYRWIAPGWEWGDPGSPVRLATSGPWPGHLDIVERAGCDLLPRDVNDPGDMTVLRSFLPYESDVMQMEFDDAVALAGRSGVVVEKADSVDWLADKLRPRPDTDAYTVVWHSLFWGFLDPAAQESITRLLDGAARRMRLATVRFEPEVLPGTPRLHVELYS